MNDIKIFKTIGLCKNCTHFSAEEKREYFGIGKDGKAKYNIVGHENYGECDHPKVAVDINTISGKYEGDTLYSWDGEGWCSGCYIGEEFGCIYWELKQ